MKYVDRSTGTPLCAASTRSSLDNLTGSWRFGLPVFVDRVSPCNQQCPAGEDIAGTLFLAGQGRYEDAWRLIMQENPFPAIMGRVCYHTCERSCNRAEHDEAVSIHCIERFLGDLALERGLQVEPPPEPGGKRAAVVGAGPAGLSAAYFLRRLGHDVTVYDAMGRPGGLMRYGIPAYRLPRDVLDGEIERLERMGIRFETGRALGGELDLESLTAESDAVFLAIGAHGERRLGLEGEELEGVHRALRFLERVAEGGPPEVGRSVAVIGGGNSAVDCARVCRRLGADVTVFYRRSEREMPAHAEEVAAAREEGVAFEFLCAPSAILGESAATGVRFSRMRLGSPDATGRRRPEATGESFDVVCSGVIPATGELPDPVPVPAEIRGPDGAAQVDPFGRTRLDKLFAGGDLAPIQRTVTHAVGSGKRAAAAMDAFMRGAPDRAETLFRWGSEGNITLDLPGGGGLFPRRNPEARVVGYDALNPFYFDRRPALKAEEVPPGKRLPGFDEVVCGAGEEAVLREARRCFGCGSCTDCGNCFIFCPDLSIRKDPGGFGYEVNLDYCKGCGICVQECPRGAMTVSYPEGDS